jgi:hypothetical protein
MFAVGGKIKQNTRLKGIEELPISHEEAGDGRGRTPRSDERGGRERRRRRPMTTGGQDGGQTDQRRKNVAKP